MPALPNSLEARDLESLLHPTTNFKRLRENGPMVLTRAKGVRVYDNNGRDYIEGMAGLWCTALGYGVEELADAAHAQMLSFSYSHLFGGKSHEKAIELAEKLKSLAPVKGKVFFGCSGSDANDTQMKLLRYYNNAVGRPQKKKIISRKRGYHGVTLASASLTGLPAQHALFDLPLPGVIHVSPPYYYRGAEPGETEAQYAARLAAELEATIVAEGPETVAGFIAEPLMGVGGVLSPPADYFPRVREVLTRHDVIMIDDEVICGFHRTNSPFGATAFKMQPDTMTIAKAMSSAYAPISAVMVPDWLYEAMIEPSAANGSFGHGFTYGGHPVSCAVALRTLELMEEWKIAEHVADVTPHFQKRLRAFADHPLVGDVRGIGLIGAIEMVADKKTKKAFDPTGAAGLACERACHENGLILRPLGDTMAFCPPLVVKRDEIDDLFHRFSRALAAITPKFSKA